MTQLIGQSKGAKLKEVANRNSVRFNRKEHRILSSSPSCDNLIQKGYNTRKSVVNWLYI